MLQFSIKSLANFYLFIVLVSIIPVSYVIAHALQHHAFNTNTYYRSSQNSTTPIALPVAACSLTDATISQCASSVVLTTDPGYTNYTWSNGSTGNSMTVTTSGTYWWETIRYDEDAVVNGNFENSANHYAGFNSSYTVNTNNLYTEGQYAVIKNPNSEHPNFAVMKDHTKGDGTGYMMVLNGAPTANVTVWQENITVQANTTYVFSVWGSSVHPTSPGILNFSINGTQLGNITLTSTTGQWLNFTVRWDSGSNTTATIGIVNQNTAASGNDFALDDISFAPVCRKNTTVNLYPNPDKPIITNTH
jgi:hypothetical protein